MLNGCIDGVLPGAIECHTVEVMYVVLHYLYNFENKRWHMEMTTDDPWSGRSMDHKTNGNMKRHAYDNQSHICLNKTKRLSAYILYGSPWEIWISISPNSGNNAKKQLYDFGWLMMSLVTKRIATDLSLPSFHAGFSHHFFTYERVLRYISRTLPAVGSRHEAGLREEETPTQQGRHFKSDGSLVR